MAFTLAETLIVMGIIGVVAALTLPNLNNSTGEKEKVAKVKKIYQNLNDAFGRAQAIYGPYDTWGLSGNGWDSFEKASERIIEFMKISKSCGRNYNGGCKTSGFPHEFDGSEASGGDDGCTYILADGSSIEIFGFSSNPYIFVDIDGPNKGPYAHGKDVFIFEATDELGYENGFYPNGLQAPTSYRDYTAWVIAFDNMDYLKLSGGKCPDGKTILNVTTNTTCK
ncbi:type II secretion system protein [bacterium]|nr:type II secretion system protein [bacterium]